MIGFLCGTMLSIWACLLSAGKPVQAPLFPLILGLLLAAPVVTVGSVGPAMGRFRPFWIEHRYSNTFLDVRPMASAAFVAAKMRLATLTVIVSWVFILAGTVFCIVFSQSVPAAITTWRRFASVYPGGQAPVICGLVCVLLPALSWRFLTDGLPFVLTGRKWIADGSVWLYLAAVLGLVSGGLWLATHRDQLPRVLALVPWLVVLCAILKAGAAAAAYRAAMRRRLIAWPEFWRGLAVWSVFTGLAVALVLLLKLPPAFGSKPTLVLGIATFAPLVRFPLATLAIEWNRRR